MDGDQVPPPAAPAKKKVKTADERYVKMTQLEHIMARPDMYIGSQERVTDDMWCFDEATETMVRRKLTWTPGLYKIFDEIIVNAADNKQRDASQNAIKIDIDEVQGKIRVWNNGEGIPVSIHKEHKIWIPEMIFGHLLTSSNYDDKEARVVGGRNGYGAKLTNVFSKKFQVKTYHRKSGKKFKMMWKDNMSKPQEPEITNVPREEAGEDYCEITFWPDFERFNMPSGLDEVVHLMKRRAYDLAGTTPKDVRVTLNGKKLEAKNFQDYVDLYPMMGEEKKSAAYAKVSDRWEVCVRPSNMGFQQMSFVNSIATTKGGKHVDYIAGQVIDKVIETIKGKKGKGKKADLDPKPHMIRPFLWIFINCLIENPSFDSQTKETLDTTKPKFGSVCDLPKNMIEYLLKSGLVERTLETVNSKLTKQMASKVKGSGCVRLTGIPKLDDANEAGSKNGYKCTLILTEGDSAKTLAVSGLGTVGRDHFGVYPLRGKPLNVRDVSMKRIQDCDEVQHVLKIMGLKIGVTYTDVSSLRYGQIMIMADQDHDGSHIKGLLINMIHHFWPSLFKLPGFLTQFITPIVKAKPNKGIKTLAPRSFFSLPDFLDWRKDTSASDQKKYQVKYYKGLGTSTAEEGRQYFSNIRDHRIQFACNDLDDERRIVMAFSKDKVEDRKKWITDFNPQTSDTVDFKVKKMKYADFIDKELILFSVADCERSIPSVIDGLKPGQRKILYGCFKRNLTKILKVAQLQGYVSEHAAYHHGDASLNMTIVGLAQDFVGANNLPMLLSDGQFGTRLGGGKDAASARYIFTALTKLSRAIYHPTDDYILDYKDDDGFPVEPHYYMPVIPMSLVNGTSGIGTGFATKIPNYKPQEIIDNVRRLLKGEDVVPMHPWYYGFKGTMEQKGPGKFVSRGTCKVHDDGIVTVTELPIDTWTNTYKKFLEELVEKEYVLNFREYHTDISVDFDIALHPAVLRQWLEQGVLEDKLELWSYVHASNIIAFDKDGKLAKYADAEAVIKEFYLVRLEGYGKRRNYLIRELQKLILKLQNMLRFINEVMDGKLVVSRKKKAVLLVEMKTRGYAAIPPEKKKKQSETTMDQEGGTTSDTAQENPLAIFDVDVEDVETPEVASASKDYDYLLGMKLWSLTQEMVNRLQKQKDQTELDYKILQGKTSSDLWLEDLAACEKTIQSYYSDRDKQCADVMRKRDNKQARLVMARHTPILGDKAKKELTKEADAFTKKAGVVSRKVAKAAIAGGGSMVDDDNDLVSGLGLSGAVFGKTATKTKSSSSVKPKPKPKAKRKKKSSDDEWESDSTTDSDTDSDDSDGPSSSSSSDDGSNGGGDSDAAYRPPEKKKASLVKKPAKKEGSPKAAPKPRAKKIPAAATSASSAINVDDDDDDFLFNGYGSTALSGGSSKSAAPKPLVAPSFIDDDDDDLLLGGGTSPPKKTVKATAKRSPAQPKKSPAKKKTASSPKKKAAPTAKRTKRNRGASSSDDSESDSSEDSSSDSSGSSSDGSSSSGSGSGSGYSW